MDFGKSVSYFQYDTELINHKDNHSGAIVLENSPKCRSLVEIRIA